MKSNFTAAFKHVPEFWLATLTIALGLGHSASQAAPAQVLPLLTNAPAWDCILSGQSSEQGILFINFSTNNLDSYKNYTFDVMGITTRVAPPNPQINPDPRGGGSGIGRGTTGTGTNTVTVQGWTNIYGYFHTSGPWTLDVDGNTVGFFDELLEYVSETATNYATNNFSFKVKITSNKKLVGAFSTSLYGNGTLHGVPLQTMTNLSGHWVGKETVNGIYTYEFFTLSNGGFPNTYDIVGSGPSYALDGKCMISSQKKIAFSNEKWFNTTNPPVIRATIGSFINTSKLLGANSQGIGGPLGSSTNFSYNAFWVSP